MFPNLNAEQARYAESNSDVANILGITRVAYESRKRTGKFSLADVNKLCDHYSCDYAYLFAEYPIAPDAEKVR